MQTKIGFDKFPVPSITTEVPLFDIVSGEALVDGGNQRLVTDAERPVSEIATKSRATSTVFDPDTIKPIPVIELFPETSETSTTLLGISRAETQLSLFSDVSTLGFDENNWEYFGYRRPGRFFSPWINRQSRDFGSHYDYQLIEETDEQAIRLGSFSVPYEYPFGERFDDQNLYIENLYQQYLAFIELGNILYQYFSTTERILEYGVDSKGREFRENFLDPDKVSLDGNDVVFLNGITDDQGFSLIDIWTRTWIDIQANLFLDPRNPTNRITVQVINTITGSSPSFADTRPGYESNYQRFILMQSKKAYRYQPGRISGFTFGAKISTDSGSNQNAIEWGIGNPTDQYVFQVRGASFNIIRRSTVPLSAEVVRAQGLDPNTAQQFIPTGNPFDIDENGIPRRYYTISIPRDNFNGDTLDGNGFSGYLLNPANVTMYKIEFGWYGAIGAKFYCYIPIDNGEARWVLMHTLVIENNLGQPCLEDPYFRFLYSININETSTIRTPQFIYKYGASCFIDGGDEGTLVQRSYNSGERFINSSGSTSLLGIWPKTEIINNAGYEKPNKKVILPKSLSVTASDLSQIEIVKCRACPGFGHNYNHGLTAGQIGRTANIRFTSSQRNRISIIAVNALDPQPSELFTQADIGSKIIADGLWSGYIYALDVETSGGSGFYEEALIERIISPSYVKSIGLGYPAEVRLKTNGQLYTIPFGQESTYPYNVRFTNYDTIAASTITLTGSKIDIQFLNPIKIDSLGHFCDFAIGVTDKKPSEELDSGGDPYIGWEYGLADIRNSLPLDDMLFGEWTQSTTGRDRLGYESSESNYPTEYVGELDYRIPKPPTEEGGLDTGVCSVLTVEVLEKSTLTGSMLLNNPRTGETDGNYYFVLTANTQFQSGSIINGELGVGSGEVFTASGVSFTSEQQSYQDGLDVIYFAKLSAQLPGVLVDTSVQIALTPVRIYGQHIDKTKIMKFNPYPLYLVCKMRDNAIINSISIKETVGDTTVTSSPKWLRDSNTQLYPIINNRAVDDLPPVNFISNNRLDSANVDNQLEQKLRPFEILDSFYVGSNETKVVDLRNIYGADRENITPDIFNTEATFVIGKTISESTGTIQISLNTAEQ